MKNFLVFCFLAIVISQTFADVSKLGEKSVSDKRKKQQSKRDFVSECFSQQGSATSLNLDGESGNSGISSGDGSSCSMFYFTVPSGLSDDLTFSFSTDDSDFTIYEMDLTFDGDWTSADDYSQSFSFPTRYLVGSGTGFTIPYCALRTGKWWAVGSITGTPVTTMSISKVTATPPLTGTMDGYAATDVSFDSGDLPFYYFLQVPTTLEKSYLANMTVSTNSFYGITAWGSDYFCPTESYNLASTQDFSLDGLGGPLLRTTSKESTLYFLVEIADVAVSSWSLNLTYQPVTCKVPSGSNDPCDLNYPTYPNDPNTISDTQSLLSFALLAAKEVGAPDSCVSATLALSCGTAFPKCDDNGYALYPCAQNCKALSSCKPSYGSGDLTFTPPTTCPPFPQSAQTFCYSSGNMVLASYTILVISVMFFLF